jgi:hypothetical protein
MRTAVKAENNEDMDMTDKTIEIKAKRPGLRG